LFNAGKGFAVTNEGENGKLGEVEPGSTFVDVASSGDTTFAVKGDGSVISWGSLRLTLKDTSDKPIVTVPLDEKITSISVSPGHVLAVSKAGVTWAWGDEPNSTFGDVTTTITKATPIPVLTVGGSN
jgi:alpha-tubulin suppressor-like RCC1 family protein